jgi:hypothetical protein
MAPVSAQGEGALRELARDLVDDRPEVHVGASGKLAKYGADASTFVREALNTPRLALDARNRLQAALDALKDLEQTPDFMRSIRLIELCEQLNTAHSRRLLEKVAQGASWAWFTSEANAALRRMAAGG